MGSRGLASNINIVSSGEKRREVSRKNNIKEKEAFFLFI
jgi:hypothetical protein